MKIKLLKAVAGSTYYFSKGKEVDAPATIAKGLIKAGHAVVIKTKTKKKK